MVLFKDLSEDATDVLMKDFPYEKLYEFEYKNKSKNIVFTNNALYNSGKGTLDTSTRINYVNCNNVTTEFKLNGEGLSSLDIKYSIPLIGKLKYCKNENNKSIINHLNNHCKYLHAFQSAFRGFTIGSKIEHSPKSKLCENNQVDLSIEYNDKRNIHSKFNLNPITKFSNFSTCLENRCTFGIFRIGAEITAADIMDISKAKYSLGFSLSKDMKPKGSRSAGKDGLIDKCQNFEYLLFPSYVFSCKTAPYMKSQIGKIIVSLHSRTYIHKCPAELALQAEHSLNDKYTSFLFGTQLYLNKNKSSSIKFKCSHDLENICFSILHKVNENVSANVGCRLDATKILDPNAFKYGAKISFSN